VLSRKDKNFQETSMLTHSKDTAKQMAVMLLAALITAIPSWAGAGGGDAPTTTSSEAGNAQPKANATKSGKAGSATPIAAELEELRQRASAGAGVRRPLDAKFLKKIRGSRKREQGKTKRKTQKGDISNGF
jgi:hypothetical protein